MVKTLDCGSGNSGSIPGSGTKKVAYVKYVPHQMVGPYLAHGWKIESNFSKIISGQHDFYSTIMIWDKDENPVIPK